MKETSSFLFLSIYRALLGEIIPELRALTVQYNEKNKILITNFFYNCKVTEEIYDLSSCINAEIISNFSSHELNDLEENVLQLNYPECIPEDGLLIYYRKEPKILANIRKTEELIKCDYLEKKIFKAQILCVMQKAILGRITPNIREIKVEWDENFIYLHFYYHNEISNSDIQNMNEIAAKLFSYFPNFYIHLLYFTINEPIFLPVHQETIYRRYEKNYGQEPLFTPLDKK